MNTRNDGLVADPLFVGATRPPMRFGVTYTAMLLNVVGTMIVFLLTKNLLTLLLAVPVHGVCALLCARDAQYFELLLAWVRTRAPSYFGTAHYWQASSYSPLELDLPNGRGHRRGMQAVYIVSVRVGGASR